MNQTTVFQIGTNTDPGVDIKLSTKPLPEHCQAALDLLGFKNVNGDGTLFMFEYKGRALWVDDIMDVSQIMPLICQSVEAIGARRKINEIREALDLPFGVLSDEQPGIVK